MHIGEQLTGYLSLDYGAADHEYTPQELALAGAVAKLAALVFERERLLRERAEAQANALALSEANRRMDEFLGIASHELRTPLTTIKLHFQLAQRRIDALRAREPVSAEVLARELARLQQQFRQGHTYTERLDHLVNDLLDVSRIQAGRLELRKAPADLVAIVRETIEEQRQLAPNRPILFQAVPEQGVMASVDGERIRQVLTNYLTNALKYSGEDRPVTVGLQVDGQQACVWVHDEGPGIPLPEQEHIWDRFHRVPGIEIQSGSGIGLGLGLHISQTIIEQHGGQVGLESSPGAGATFWFSLPLSSS